MLKSLIKRYLCIVLLVLTTALTVQVLNLNERGAVNPFAVRAHAASVVKSWSYNDVTKLSSADAQIKATVNFSNSVKISKSGFYIGTSKDNLKKNSKPDVVNKSYKSVPMWFLMSKYGEKLKANTTYYYKFYVIVSGKEYCSAIKSFKTKASTPALSVTWSYEDVTKLSTNDAQIKTTVKLSKSTKVNQAGFYIGTSESNLKKNSKPDTVDKAYTSLPMWYLMSKYQGKLNENTTYYYKFYITAGGKEYCSAVKSFKTKAPTSVLSVTWSYEDVTKLSTNDAQIKATAKLSKNTKINQAGFYIGTSESNLKKNSKPDTVDKAYTSLPMWYLMSKYQGKLTENTTYYYKFYITIDGKEYCSSVQKFKTKEVPVSVISWFTNASGIGEKKANIEANASTSKTVSVTEGGFYIGTDSDNNMKRYAQKYSKAYSDTNFPFSFDTGKYLNLTPGTKYFYKVYFIADGKTYTSSVKSFTTKYAVIEGKPTDTFTHVNGVSISNIKSTEAKLTLTEKFNKKVTVSEYGLYIGTVREGLKKSSKINKVKNVNSNFCYTYDVSEYTKLKRNTKYYIQTYIIADGKTYKSQIKSFKTADELTWPALNRGQKNITQGYHKGCMDIGGSKQTVVAAMGGTVYKYYLCNKSHVPKNQGGDGKGASASCCGGFGNGLIIKGNDGRYYQYAHMYKNSIPKSLRKKGAKVKEGQVIGRIGNTGYSFGAHLHFGISTTTNFTKSKVDPMLEKYKGIDIDYFKKISVSNIKKNDAKIDAKIVNTNVSKIGFYIGTDKKSMKKYTEKYSGKLSEFYYPIKKWCGSLKANTKYYYKFYIVVNGKEIQSDIKSFTTLKK